MATEEPPTPRSVPMSTPQMASRWSSSSRLRACLLVVSISSLSQPRTPQVSQTTQMLSLCLWLILLGNQPLLQLSYQATRLPSASTGRELRTLSNQLGLSQATICTWTTDRTETLSSSSPEMGVPKLPSTLRPV